MTIWQTILTALATWLLLGLLSFGLNAWVKLVHLTAKTQQVSIRAARNSLLLLTLLAMILGPLWTTIVQRVQESDKRTGVD